MSTVQVSDPLGCSRNTITLDIPPPLLAIEVVSPDNPARDYRHKRSEYAVRGIPTYWTKKGGN